MCRAWEAIEAYTIGAIEGFCIGGGSALASSLDYRFMGEGAHMRLPEIALGMNMSWHAIPRLVAQIGPALTKRYVILCEKSAQLGGTLRFASLVYEPNEQLLRWLETQVRKLPIDIRLQTEVTPERVREIAPDVVLVGVGASREVPDVLGIGRDHVFDGDELRALLSGEGSKRASDKLSLVGRLALRAGRAMGVTSDPSKLRKASKAYMPIEGLEGLVG